MRAGLNLTILSALFLFYGCSSFSGKISGPVGNLKQHGKLYETRDLLSRLKNDNNSLKTFKGIGEITLWRNKKIQIDERIAWVGAEPISLSIVILVSGHPAIKFASNGKYLYYLNSFAGKNPFGKIPATDASLKRLISIPINTSDLVTFLTGRIPIRKHDSIELIPERDGNGNILVLKKWWWTVEKIYLDGDLMNVRKVEVFDITGSLMYRALLSRMQNIQGYRIPLKLIFSTDDEDVVFQLIIDKYQPNISVSPSMFVLIPPT